MNPVWLLMSAIGVIGANSLVLSPIAEDVAGSFEGHAAADVLIASAAYGAGTAISALVLAPQADRIGLQHALLFALTVLAATLAFSALTPTLWGLTLAQTLAGFAAGLALPAIYGLAAEVAPAGRESETLGKVLTGWTLSLVLGVTASALLSDILHWRWVYSGLACACLLIAAALRRAHLQVETHNAKATSPLKALVIPGLPPILISVGAYMVAFYGLYAYLGPHLTTKLNVSTTIAGGAALAYGTGFGAVAPLDHLIDRHGSRVAAPYAFAALVVVYLFLAGSAGSAPLLLGTCLLWGAANHVGLNILVGQLTALSPTQRGTILGLYSAVTYAAVFLGTAAFKPAFEHMGFESLALLSALCVTPALLAALQGRRRYRSLR